MADTRAPHNAHLTSPSQGQTLEKDFSNQGMGHTNGYQNSKSMDGDTVHMDDTTMDNDTALRRIRTAGSISISPELFEKIYLSPQNNVKGDLRKTFGNPTPVALLGFLISLTPLSCDLMGWRGAGGLGAASTGAYFFFGGLLMVVGGFLEFVLGNTFPFVVFMSFGAFWLTFAATLQPFYNSWAFYAPAGSASPSAGLTTQGFNASFGFFTLSMGVLCLIYLVCSLRTNITFFIIFFTLVLAFGCLTGAYFHNAQGNAAMATNLIVAGGACAFVTCCAGWWIFFAILLTSVDFPFTLPVGDLSTMIKGQSERARARESTMV